MIKKIVLLGVLFFNSIILRANVFLVTHTADSGVESLRAAITDANNHAGSDTIRFNIPLTDANFNGFAWEIRPGTALPTFTDAGTWLDGFSQTQQHGDTNPNGPEIVLNGTDAGDVPGLSLQSSGVRISGLVIGRFKNSGINVSGRNTSGIAITGCFIGLDYTGFAAFSNGLYGIYIKDAFGNTIGGTIVSERNLISGNLQHGIYLKFSSHNAIIGNYMGTDKNGMAVIGNGYGTSGGDSFGGIFINSSKHNKIGGSVEAERNILSGNGKAGIIITNAGADSNQVLGNWIGLAADGLTILSNGEAGIQLRNYCAFNIIGGLEPGAGNVVSGNQSSGIQLRGNGVKYNIVAGNRIGTDPTGKILIGNSHNGIYLFNDTVNLSQPGPQYNQIGPGNIICGTWHPEVEEWAGVRIDYVKTDSNTIYGNYIGQSPDGSLQSGFPQGVRIGNGAQKNTIGPDNLIAHHLHNGVTILGSNTRANTITRNMIFATPVSIKLMNGANDNIVAPQLAVVGNNYVTGQTVAYGLVEIYSSQSPGEVELFEGNTRADSSGVFYWQGNLHYNYINSTVTDNVGNTSELAFSYSVPVELASFTAQATGDGVIVRWITLSESDNYGFEIQISKDRRSFDTVGFLPGHGTTQVPQSYIFNIYPASRSQKFIRLKQIDLDGTFNFSQVIELNFSPVASFKLFPGYPNPLTLHSIQAGKIFGTTIAYELPAAIRPRIVIYDITGRRVREVQPLDPVVGKNFVVWNGNDDLGRPVPVGVYMIHIQADHWQATEKITILK